MGLGVKDIVGGILMGSRIVEGLGLNLGNKHKKRA
jgi:hypothetical protein